MLQGGQAAAGRRLLSCCSHTSVSTPAIIVPNLMETPRPPPSWGLPPPSTEWWRRKGREGGMASQTMASYSSRQKQLTPTASALCQLSTGNCHQRAEQPKVGWCSPLFLLENNQKNFINLTSNSFKRAFNLIFDPLI